LLKAAPILLLDEPTAHLDAEAEAALARTIARAARGRTTLIATHSARLAAIADRIVRLEVA
jgi:ATP-binding cassette subfamily C protein CydD